MRRVGVLSGGGDPLAGMQGGVWGASGSFLYSLQSLEGTVVTVIGAISALPLSEAECGSASAMSCRCPASSCTTSTSASNPRAPATRRCCSPSANECRWLRAVRVDLRRWTNSNSSQQPDRRRSS